ncbi:MAG: hypothetical protein HC914_14685 [Chloroflexaceae bacterium]|nr:hypothetical protein [Chloroflexaceae bacterium]
MNIIPKNPLTMRGRFTHCWLFTYQTPAEAVRHLLPPPFELITHRGCAFWNIVVCEIHAMRPAPLPALVGIAYRHVAYRLYTRCPTRDGSTIEGLYFLRSDCNRPLMTLAGNLVTDFNFHTAPIHLHQHGPATVLQVDSPDAPAHATLRPDHPAQLPRTSAFATLAEAAAFLKYQPAGLSLAHPGIANIVHITRDEAAWQSTLVHVEAAAWGYLRDQPVTPEICYQVAPIAYQWNRGRRYPVAA